MILIQNCHVSFIFFRAKRRSRLRSRICRAAALISPASPTPSAVAQVKAIRLAGARCVPGTGVAQAFVTGDEVGLVAAWDCLAVRSMGTLSVLTHRACFCERPEKPSSDAEPGPYHVGKFTAKSITPRARAKMDTTNLVHHQLIKIAKIIKMSTSDSSFLDCSYRR